MMQICDGAWQTGSRFALRMADLGLAQLDGSIQRGSKIGRLHLDHLAAQWPLLLAPSPQNALRLGEATRSFQDELLEDGCNLMQIAILLESELMYWSQELSESLAACAGARPAPSH